VAELAAIYCRLVGARIRGDLQYRVSFFMFMTSQFLVAFLDYLAIVIIFSHVPRLAGWSLGEVMFLYGATNVSFNLADLFISQVETLPTRVRTGTFDSLLIRPLGPLFQLATEEFALRRIGKLAQGVLVLVLAIDRLRIDWTVGRIGMTVVMLLSGAVIFGAIWVATAAVNIWTIETTQFGNAFTYGGNFLSQYPIDIYSAWLRRVFAYLLPVAFVNYFPALYILGRPNHFGIPALRFMSPLVALVTAIAAGALWRLAIRHYRSTGS
jgi:ABC-2 type transport system permease protein